MANFRGGRTWDRDSAAHWQDQDSAVDRPPAGMALELMRGRDGGRLLKTELARREPERALLYRGIGAVREEPRTRTGTTVNQRR